MFLDSLNGQLPNEQQEQFSTHIQECPACSREYSEQSELLEVLKYRRPMPEMDEAFWDGYWDRLQEKAMRKREEPHEIPTAFFYRKALLPAAAVLLVVLGIIMGRFWWPANSGGPVPIGTPWGANNQVVEQHFETLRPILIDYANSGEEDVVDKEILKSLLMQNRLLKRMASRAQNVALLRLLEDLDIVILEMLNGGDRAGSSSPGVGRMIRENDILLKMKVLNRNERNTHNLPI